MNSDGNIINAEGLDPCCDDLIWLSADKNRIDRKAAGLRRWHLYAFAHYNEMT